MLYLVELTGWNPSTEALDYVRAATAGYVSRPTDDPANAVWDPILATALSVETSLFQSGTTGGASAVGAGDIELLNDKGKLDHLLEWDWAGHPVRVWSLPTAGSPFAAATLIFRGSIVQPEFGLDTVRFTLRDRTADLEVPVCPNRYAGDNVPPSGQEGGSELKDVVKPRALGLVRNLTPKLVNPQKRIYQVNDGPATILAVYDSGLNMDLNRIVSGDFSRAEPWQFGIGTSWDEANGRAELGYGLDHPDIPAYEYANTISQVLDLTPGAAYRLLSDYHYSTPVGSAQLTAYILSPTGPTSPDPLFQEEGATLNGTANVEFVAGDGQRLTFMIGCGWSPSAGGWIDNVHVVQVLTDHPDLASLEAVVVPAGGFHTCEALGLFRLGADPAGEVTADVLGQGSAAAADLALALAREKFADADIDLPAFAALKALNAAEVGLLVDDETTIAAALDSLLGALGAWWTLTPTGVLTCGRFEAPAGAPDADVVVDADVLESGGIERVATADGGNGVPVWKVTVGYQRNCTLQLSDLLGSGTYMNQSVVGAVTDERRIWLNAELRTVVAEDAALKERLPGAVELRVDTLLDSQADAEAEAARLLALFSVRRDRYRLTLPRRYFGGLGLGGVVRLTWDRFGLALGKLFSVIGEAVTVDGDSDTIDLDVWG